MRRCDGQRGQRGASFKALGGYGADRVYYIDSPLLKDYTTDAYAKVVCDVIIEKKPEVLLIGATNIGRDLGPRCAARLHTGLTADCTHLDVDIAKYKDFLRTTSTIDLANRSLKEHQPEDDPSRIRRPPDGYHHLPALPPPNVHRAPRRYEEGSLRRPRLMPAKTVKPAFSCLLTISRPRS